MARCAYNGVWLTGTGTSEADALESMEQFYMNETAQGKADSVIEVVDT